MGFPVCHRSTKTAGVAAVGFYSQPRKAGRWLAFLCVLAGVMFHSLVPPVAARGTFPVETLVLVTDAGRHTIKVEVAETAQQKALGLMFRTEVPPGTGMIFPYRQPQELTMWMRNTYVSLDMIFIRGDGRVHRIAENTTPLSDDVVASNGKVTAVLELQAGEARRLGLKVGDRVVFRSFPDS